MQRPRAGIVERVAWIAPLGIVVAVVVWRWAAGDPLWLLWADRDLVRADVPWSELPTMGAELSYGTGARVPGGGSLALVKLGLGFGGGAAGAYRFMLVLDALGLVALGVGVRRRFGDVAAVTAVAGVALAGATTDTLRTLWNPGFATLWAALAWVCALVLAAGGGWPAALGLGLAVGIGAQMHFSLWMLGAVLVVGSAGALRRGWAWGAVLVGAVLPLVPYLVHEVSTGGAEAALFFQQSQLGGLVSPDGPLVVAARNGRALLGLVGGVEVPGESRHLARLGLAVAAVPWVLGAVGLGIGRPATARLPAAVVVVGLGYYLVDRNIDLGVTGSGRYLVGLLPAVGVLAGLGVAELAGRLGPRGRVALAAALLLGHGARGLGTWRQIEADGGSPRALSAWRSMLAEVEVDVGGGLAEVAGRTVVAFPAGEGWAWKPAEGIDALLAERGEVFPGSLPGPCRLILAGGADAALSDEALSALLGQPARVLGRSAMTGGHALLRYEVGGSCSTSLVDRYLRSPAERVMQPRVDDLPLDQAVEVETDGPGRRWLIATLADRRPAHARIGIVLDLDPDGTVTLHSNQLRGRAFNAGPHFAAVLERPRIERGEEVVVFDPGLVGLMGALPPLRVSVGSLDGPLVFAAEVVGGVEEGRWPPPAGRRTLRINLAGGEL